MDYLKNLIKKFNESINEYSEASNVSNFTEVINELKNNQQEFNKKFNSLEAKLDIKELNSKDIEYLSKFKNDIAKDLDIIRKSSGTLDKSYINYLKNVITEFDGRINKYSEANNASNFTEAINEFRIIIKSLMKNLMN